MIRDLIVEGLSLARTQKEEFKSIIQNNDEDINAFLNLWKNLLLNNWWARQDLEPGTNTL